MFRRTFAWILLALSDFSHANFGVLCIFFFFLKTQAISERKHFIRAGRPAVGLMDNKPPPLDSWVWTRQHGRSSCWKPARTLSISQTLTCAIYLIIFVQTEVEKKNRYHLFTGRKKKYVPNIYMYLKMDFFCEKICCILSFRMICCLSESHDALCTTF